MMPDDFAQRMSSRKFGLVVLVVIIATALLLIDKVTPEIWAGVMEWLVAAYVLGNVVGKSKWLNGDSSQS